MSEFGPFEIQKLAKQLKGNDQMMFTSQYDSVKKDPGTMMLLAVILGGWGVDRFMLGDMGMGLLKLLTFGGCGILWLVDIFSVKDRTGEFNRKKAQEIFYSIKS